MRVFLVSFVPVAITSTRPLSPSLSSQPLSRPEMVTHLDSRKRGPSREMAKRNKRRLEKANAVQAGKIKKPTVVNPGKSKKKMKKLEQRARLLAKGKGGDGSKMEI